jgi:hypothetical protein
MLRNPRFAVVFVSAYLTLYCIFFLAGYRAIIPLMFILSPVLVVWMVITVLKNGKYNGTELTADEEWGYEDKHKSDFN